MTLSITEKQKPTQPEDKEVILSVEGVSKKFCRDLKRSLFYGVQDITTDLLGLKKSNPSLRPKEFWALDNVSFQLCKGEALGLIGKNGSGKSTLLRIIAGLIKPDKGQVRVKGRVAPLIALGAGFNPILTGRENIYANMSILGLSKKEIDAKFDEVVEFAEIGDAIDSPVQSYSSGMAARLGFASAIHTEPDILLIDEVLAVGDIKFRAKCHRRLAALREKKTAFLLVSHQSQAILNVCESSVYLSQGKLLAFGETNSVMTQYEQELFLDGLPKAKNILYLPEKTIQESLGIDITHLLFRNNSGEILKVLKTGESVNFCLGYQARKKFDNIHLIVTISEMAGEGDVVIKLSSSNDKSLFQVVPGKHEIRVHMPYLCLKTGIYNMKVYLRQGNHYLLDYIEHFAFTVDSEYFLGKSLFYQPREWQNLSI